MDLLTHRASGKDFSADFCRSAIAQKRYPLIPRFRLRSSLHPGSDRPIHPITNDGEDPCLSIEAGWQVIADNGPGGPGDTVLVNFFSTPPTVPPALGTLVDFNGGQILGGSIQCLFGPGCIPPILPAALAAASALTIPYDAQFSRTSLTIQIFTTVALKAL